MINKNYYMNNDLINSNNYYMYEKNKKFCSGYFPSFITLDDDKYYQISNNTNPDNIKNNYYLKIKNNKYLKQLVNKNSKYNYEYFNNLKDAYRISKKHSTKLVDTLNPTQVQNSQSGVTINNSKSKVSICKPQSMIVGKKRIKQRLI